MSIYWLDNTHASPVVILQCGNFKAIAIALSFGLRASQTNGLRFVAFDSTNSRGALGMEAQSKHPQRGRVGLTCRSNNQSSSWDHIVSSFSDGVYSHGSQIMAVNKLLEMNKRGVSRNGKVYGS
jgi:hypothetical protein